MKMGMDELLPLLFLAILIQASAIAITPAIASSHDSIVRHMNPATVNPDVFPQAYVRSLIDMFNLLNVGEFRAVQELTATFKLGGFGGHLGIRLLDRMGNLTSKLNITRSDIDRLRGLALKGDIKGMMDVLPQTMRDLASANVTLEYYIEPTLKEFSRLTRIDYGSVEGEGVNGTRKVIKSYLDEIRGILRSLYGATTPGELPEVKVEETAIAIWANSSSVPPGCPLSISGRLYLKGNWTGLEGRDIGISVDGTAVAEISTGSSGSFEVSIDAPMIYKRGFWVQASYRPSGADVGRLAPSMSKPIFIVLDYVTPTISARAPARTLPGEWMTISGSARAPGEDTSGLEVTVTSPWGNVSTSTGEGGVFTVALMVPPDAEEGRSTMKVETSPRGRVGPATTTIETTVYRTSRLLHVEVPDVVLSGLAIDVKGVLTGEDGVPMPGQKVLAMIDHSTTAANTAGDGRFELKLSTDPMYWGNVRIDIEAPPPNPGYRPTRTAATVYIVGWPYILAMIVVAAMGIAQMRRARWPHRHRPKPGSEPKPRRMEARAAENPPMPKEGPSRAVEAYWAAVDHIAGRTGTVPRPQMTLREYYRTVEGLIDGASIPFWKLTEMAEEDLYSQRRLSPHEAIELLRMITEMI